MIKQLFLSCIFRSLGLSYVFLFFNVSRMFNLNHFPFIFPRISSYFSCLTLCSCSAELKKKKIQNELFLYMQNQQLLLNLKAKFHQTNHETFCFWFQWTLTDSVVTSRYLRVSAIWSVSNTVLLAQLPGSEGVTARESILGPLVLLVLIFWVWDSGRKGFFCPWEQSVDKSSQHFCNQKPCRCVCKSTWGLAGSFWAQPSLWGGNVDLQCLFTALPKTECTVFSITGWALST